MTRPAPAPPGTPSGKTLLERYRGIPDHDGNPMGSHTILAIEVEAATAQPAEPQTWERLAAITAQPSGALREAAQDFLTAVESMQFSAIGMRNDDVAWAILLGGQGTGGELRAALAAAQPADGLDERFDRGTLERAAIAAVGPWFDEGSERGRLAPMVLAQAIIREYARLREGGGG